VDVGYGGDPIVPHAICVDLPKPYTSVGAHPQHLACDIRLEGLRWFQNGSLDFVYSSHLLEDFNWDVQRAIMEDFKRVIKPGGYIVIYGPDQVAYENYCRDHGTTPNAAHKIHDYSLALFKKHALPYGMLIAHHDDIIDDYCWELVLRKI